MALRLTALCLALAFFLTQTVLTIAAVGYVGFFDAMAANAATRLAMLDLTIVLTLALIWMFRDARQRGASLAEWGAFALVTLGFGAAGPLGYLIRRELAQRDVAIGSAA